MAGQSPDALEVWPARLLLGWLGHLCLPQIRPALPYGAPAPTAELPPRLESRSLLRLLPELPPLELTPPSRPLPPLELPPPSRPLPLSPPTLREPRLPANRLPS